MAKTVRVRKHKRGLNKTKAQWVIGTLTNDETSSDKELVEYFMREGNLSEAQARFYISQRDRALRDPLHFMLLDYNYII